MVLVGLEECGGSTIEHFCIQDMALLNLQYSGSAAIVYRVWGRL